MYVRVKNWPEDAQPGRKESDQPGEGGADRSTREEVGQPVRNQPNQPNQIGQPHQPHQPCPSHQPDRTFRSGSGNAGGSAAFDAFGGIGGTGSTRGAGSTGGTGSTGVSDGWFRREAAAAVPRQRNAERKAGQGAEPNAERGAADSSGGTAVFAFDPNAGQDAGHDSGYDSGQDAGHDSWQESEHPEHPEHTHDPHEVTVQMDGVGRHLEDWLVQQAKGAPGAQEPSDGPVFVDETGRRSRRYRRIGMAVGMVCAVYAMVILVTLISGNSNAPWLPLKDQEKGAPAGEVDTPRLPVDSADPSGSASASPEASVSGSDGTTPTPTPEANIPTAPSASESIPVEPADPRPSTSSTGPRPGDNSPDPDPTGEASSSPDPDPEPSDTGVSGNPTETADEGDTDAVATDPLTAEPTPIEPSPPLPSPENIL